MHRVAAVVVWLLSVVLVVLVIVLVAKTQAVVLQARAGAVAVVCLMEPVHQPKWVVVQVVVASVML